MRGRRTHIAAAVLLAGLLGAGCGPDERPREMTAGTEAPAPAAAAQAAAPAPPPALTRALDAAHAHARRIDEALAPIALLNSREQAGLRIPSRRQLEAARRLGVDRPDARQREAHVEAGRLVRLPDSSAYWIVRELDHSMPYVTPDALALLETIGERFQARLDALGIPPLRYEISSALRTSDLQADLRQSNPNAARSVSTHEYGTTVDIAYNGFHAPAERLGARVDGPWDGIAAETERLAVERVAGRRSHELKALLGRTLRELQDEGAVMVTLEERQPVFHLTVAKRMR